MRRFQCESCGGFSTRGGPYFFGRLCSFCVSIVLPAGQDLERFRKAVRFVWMHREELPSDGHTEEYIRRLKELYGGFVDRPSE